MNSISLYEIIFKDFLDMNMLRLRRQTDPKQSILRDVYHENLRMLGRGHPELRKRHLRLKSSWFILPILVFLVFGGVEHLNSVNKTEITLRGGDPTGEDLSALSFMAGGAIPLKKVFGLGVKTIVIDPGHGGQDPGTTGKIGLVEKDITLDIARMLRDRLIKQGYNVLLTRDSDVTLPLTSRVWFANRHKADLFISIHVNYVPYKPINIIETYYFGPPKDDETLRLASVENAESHYRIGEFREIIQKVGDTLKIQESKKLASFIQESLYLNISGQNRDVLDYGIKTAPFVVLLGVEMPAVLAEVSCLSNKEEEMKLHSQKYRDDIAQYIESGILNYLKKGDTIYEARRNW